MHRYVVVDVFTDTPLEGNPAAVVTDARGIPAGRMQRIASEGAEVGRPSRLYACAAGSADRIDSVEVAGAAVIVARGELDA